MISFAPKNYSKRLLPIISWSHWFTFFNILLAIVLSSVYLINEARPETFIGSVYLLTNLKWGLLECHHYKFHRKSAPNHLMKMD